MSPVSDGSTSCTDSAITQVGSFDVAGYRPIMVARWTLRAMAACFVEDLRPDTLVPSSITKSGWASWSSPLKLPTRPMKIPLDPGCSRPTHHFRWRSYRANRVMDNRPWPSLSTACTRALGMVPKVFAPRTSATTATSSPTLSVAKSDIPVPEM